MLIHVYHNRQVMSMSHTYLFKVSDPQHALTVIKKKEIKILAIKPIRRLVVMVIISVWLDEGCLLEFIGGLSWSGCTYSIFGIVVDNLIGL